MCKLPILIIENDVKVIDCLKQIISNLIENAETFFVNNEEEAIKLLEKKPISLVMLNSKEANFKEIFEKKKIQVISYNPTIDFNIDIQ